MVLLQDINFNKAFIFSAIWHIFWMSVVVVVVVPNNLDIGRFTNISFLGAYLSDVSLPPSSSRGIKLREPFYNLRDILSAETASADLPQRSAPSSYKADFSRSNPSATPPADERPDNIETGSPDIVYARAITGQLDGEAKDRAVLYKPDISPLRSSVARSEAAVSEVELRLGVSGSGEVKFVAMLTSTGNPELDTAVTRYIRLWKFEPLSGYEGKIQIGKVKLAF